MCGVGVGAFLDPRKALRQSQRADSIVSFDTPTLLEGKADGRRKANMPRIDDLSDAEFMKLQAEYGDNLPICPICTLEDVRHLLLELVAGDAVSDDVKDALAPVLHTVTGALVADRTMAEQGGGSAHLGGDEDYDDDGMPARTQ
jgi:hypothetical protein